jgi:hypothetical protein
MLDLGYEKVVACDISFETNDKQVLSSIYLQWFIFSGSTWSFQLMNVVFVTIHVVYAHGLQ